MRLLLFIGILVHFLTTEETVELKGKRIEVSNYYELKEQEYIKNYDSTINFIKYHEGFRANWYDDFGYACIGYGQRQLCYRKQIIAPITKEQATVILKDSFNEHIKYVKHYFPKLTGNKQLAVAHMSYCMGIGKVIRSKVIVNGQLNADRLLSFQHKGNRKFEINLFNQ